MVSIFIFFSSQIACYILSLAKTPAFSVAGYILIYFLYDSSRWWHANVPELNYSFYISGTILVLAFHHRNSSESVFGDRIILLLIVLGVYYYTINFWAVAPDIHTYDALNFVKLLLVVIASVKLATSRHDLEKLIWAFTLGCAYIGYYILETGRTAYGRVEGVGVVDAPDVNGLAATLVIGAIFSLMLFWFCRGFQRLISIVCGALIVNALVLMNSRGAFLGVLTGAGWFVLQTYRSSFPIAHKKLKILSLVAAGATCLMLVVDQSAIDRFLSIKDEAEITKDKQTGYTRLYFWAAAFEMSKDFPFGAGARSFIVLSPEYISDDINTGSLRNRAAHSTWFQALTETGYPGLIILCLTFATAFIYLFRIKQSALILGSYPWHVLALGLEAAMIGHLTAISFLDRFRGVSLYILILMIVVCYRAGSVDSKIGRK
ncbi:MAG: O-antigen ligase family protein [Pseudohaliea sp.]